MPHNEGQWYRNWFKNGPDSQLQGIRHKTNAPFSNIDRISLGSIFLTQPEPVYKQHTVVVDLVTGGKQTNVAWPGAQVNANATGLIPGGTALGIHGLWESPLPGQMVLVGYVDGSSGNPIVINKYPYNALNRPELEAMHLTPLTQLSHGPTDIILGHHTGSFIALRGTLPLPAQIDILSLSAMTMTIGLNLDIAVTATVNINSGAAMSFISGAAVSITASPGVIINSGTRPVAANGDLTPTLMGPSPITATGTACLVP